MVTLKEIQPTLAAVLPLTRYFEIRSQIADATYAVWVTAPALYDREPERRYPAVYQPDGNLAVGQTAGAQALTHFDPIAPIRPFLHVCVGYTGEDAARQLAVRARDLLPPGEALLAGTEEMVLSIVETGMLDQAGAELYLHHLRTPAADRFQAFLEQELHPALVERFRVEPDEAGLFGYSYGGLFATYVALRRSSLFRRIGAGSPGILAGTSKIFAQYADELTSDTDHTGRHLHMTVCGPELTAPSFYQSIVGAGAVEFIARAGQTPLRGLAFSSHIVPYESHVSGFTPAWFSFLRTCYGVDK